MPDARAVACPATVLGHAEEPPAAACCPRVSLGRKDCAGGTVQEEKAPTHRPLPTLHLRCPQELWHDDTKLYSKAAQLAQLMPPQKSIRLRAAPPLELQEPLRTGYITWPAENLNQRLFPLVFRSINNDNLNLTSLNSGKGFI